MKKINLLLAGILILGTGILHADGTFTENFTSTATKDAAATTVLWDTESGGEVRLPLSISSVGKYSAGGNSIGDIVIKGGLAFFSRASNSYLNAVDITNPASITLKDSIDCGGTVRGIAVQGNYAYVTAGTYFKVIDISSSTDIKIVGSYAFGVNLAGVDVWGNRAVIAKSAFGSDVYLLDISISSSPSVLDSDDLWNGLGDVFIKSGIVYIAGNDGLSTYQITDSQINYLTTLSLSGNFSHGVYVSSNCAYVANDTEGLKIIDVSNPSSPNLVGTYNKGNGVQAMSVFVSGNYAYLGYASNGMNIIDISDKVNPRLHGVYNTICKGVVAEGPYAYIDEDSDFAILKVNDISNLVKVGENTTPNASKGLHIQGNYAYSADNGNAQLEIFNISVPENPISVNTFSESDINDVFVSGRYAYLAVGNSGLNGVRILDISDPASIGQKGSVNNLNDPTGIWVDSEGRYAYVADGSSLTIVNVLDVNAPYIVGSATVTTSSARRVVVKSSYAYVACGSGMEALNIFDISAASAPVYVTKTGAFSATNDVYVSGSYAYVAGKFTTGESDLRIYDISDPAVPVFKGGMSDASGSGYNCVFVSGKYAYVGDNNKIRVVNIAFPDAPDWEGDGYSQSCNDIWVSGNHIFNVDDSIIALRGEFEFNTSSDTVQSTIVDTSTGVFVSATLTPDDTCVNGSSVTYYVSANGGDSWVNLLTGGATDFAPYSNTGSSLCWRAYLNGISTATPYISSVTISYTEIFTPYQPASFTGSVISTYSINWSWVDNSTDTHQEDGFRIYTSTDGLIKTLDTNTTYWYEQTELTTNTTYTRYVQAYNADGSSDSAKDTECTLAEVPGYPTVNNDADKTTQLKIFITSSKKSNPDYTEFAILNETLGKYLLKDATLQSETTFYSYTEWGGAAAIYNIGLSTNTEYGYRVIARNLYGIVTDSSSITSKYTCQARPGKILIKEVSPVSITVKATEVQNLNKGDSGIYFENITVSTDSGWLQNNEWVSGDLQPNTTYSFRAKARNGAELATGWSLDDYVIYTAPVTPTLESDSHPNEGQWYSSSTVDATVIAGTNGFDHFHYVFDQTEFHDDDYVTANGAEEYNTDFSTSATNDGIWYLHVVAHAKHNMEILEVENSTSSSNVAKYTVYIDTTPPGAVSSLSATPSGVEATINLNWTNPSDSDYQGTLIVRSTNSVTFTPSDEASYTVSQEVETVEYVIHIVSAIAKTDSSLNEKTSYYYKAWAYDNVPKYSLVGSSEVAKTGDFTAPNDLAVTASDKEGEENQAVVSWTQSDAADFAGYRVYRSTNNFTDSGNAIDGVVFSTPTITYTVWDDTSVVDGKTYYYAVAAYDTANNEDTTVTTDSVTPADDVKPTIPDSSKLHVNQEDPGTNDTIYGDAGAIETDVILTVKVYKESSLTNLIGSFSTTTVSGGFGAFSIGNNQADSNDLVWVVAVDTAGNVSTSTSTANNVSSPSDLSTTASDKTNAENTATISWTQSDAVDFAGYRVYRSTNNFTNSGNALYGVIFSTTIQTYIVWDDTSVVDGATYYYAVAAYDTANNEDATVTADSVTPADDVDPTMPDTNYITLVWNPPGTDDTIAGQSGAVVSTDTNKVKVYKEAALTTLLGEVTVNSNNTFDSFAIGDNQATDNWIYIVAVDTAGNVSASTGIVNNVSSPPDLTVTAADKTGVENVAVISWTQSDAADFAGYKVYRSSNNFTNSGNALSGVVYSTTTQTYTVWDDTSVVDGETYYYAVAAYDTANNEDATVTADSVTPADDVKPTIPDSSKLSVNQEDPGTNDTIYGDAGAIETDVILTVKVYKESSLTNLIGSFSTTTVSGGFGAFSIGNNQADSNDLVWVVAVDTAGNVSTSTSTANNVSSPSDLSTTASDKTNAENTATISWTQSSAVDFAGYRVYRSTNNFTNSGNALYGVIFSTTIQTYIVWDDTSVVDGATYYYAVAAYDTANNEDATVTADSVTPADDVKPTKPDVNQITLVWNSPRTDDTIAGSAGAVVSTDTWKVKVYKEEALTTLLGETNVKSDGSFNSFAIGDNQATDNLVYIVAVDTAGNVSASTGIVNNVSSPLDLTVTAADKTGAEDTATISWTQSDASDFAGYKVYRSTNNFTDSGNALSGVVFSTPTQTYIVWDDTSVVDGATYYYAVAAYDTANNEDTTVTTDSVTPADDVKPTIPDSSKLHVNQNDPGVNDTIYGDAGAIESSVNLTVKVYKESSLTNLIGSFSTTTVSGGFGAFSIGMSENADSNDLVWVVVVDGSSNVSDSTSTINNVSSPSDLSTVAADKTGAEDTATISWTQSDASDFAGYKVYRSTNNFTNSGNALYGVIFSTTIQTYIVWDDTSVVDGKTYYYAVAAYDTANNEDTTVTTDSVTPADDVKPTKPDVNQITLVWNSPGTDDTIAGSAGAVVSTDTWKIKVYKEAALTTLLGETNVKSDGSFNSFAIGDNQATDNLVYIVAVDTAGNVSASTGIVNNVSSPLDLTVTAADKTGVENIATISWTQSSASDFAGYRVYRSTNNFTDSGNAIDGVVFSTPTITYTVWDDTSVVDGETYYYAVAAYDTANNEDITVTTDSATPADDVKPATPDSSKLHVNQNDPGVNDTIYGDAGAIESSVNLTVKVYKESTLTNLIGSFSTTTVSGGFGAFSIGMSENADSNDLVWVVVVDGSSNVSDSTSTINNVSSPSDLSTVAADKTGAEDTATISWTQSDASDFAGYRVYRSTNDFTDSDNATVALTTPTQTYTVWDDTSVVDGQTYYYAVAAYDTIENQNKTVITDSIIPLDDVSPAAPITEKIAVTMNNPGTKDALTGSAGAVESSSTVKVYKDSALTALIGQAAASGDGSFGAFSIGDNQADSSDLIYIVAVDASDNVSLSTTAVNDITPPAAPSSSMTITMNAPGTSDTLSGLAGAAESSSTVKVYKESALETLLGQTVAAGDGSFAAFSIGDNTGDSNNMVYVVAVDTAGNISAARALKNDPSKGTVTAAQETTVVASDSKTKVKLNANALSNDGYVNINLNAETSPDETAITVIQAANETLQKDTKGNKDRMVSESIVEFNAYDTNGIRQTGNFGAAVTITLPYNDANDDGIVDNTSPPLNAVSLKIYVLNETTEKWEEVPGSVVDSAVKTVSADVTHFSVYALLAQPAYFSNLGSAHPYPTPFKPGKGHTKITFTNLTQKATVDIYTIDGLLIKTLEKNDGSNSITWNNPIGDGVSSGVYIYVITPESGRKEVGKFIIIK